MSIATIEPTGGVIGPNAITRMSQALREAGGDALCADVFAAAGLLSYLASPPTRMVPERDVASLHRVVIERLGEAHAAQVSQQAGRLTGDYLLENRIPVPAQIALGFLPRTIAARILVAAIARHAWTFAGSGEFTYAFSPRLTLRLQASPICRGLHTQQPACAYLAATFERVFGAMLGPDVCVREIDCEAMGAGACLFEVGW